MQTTEEEELTRAVGAKRVEYSRLHVVLLERMQQMQDVGHVYRKMCLEQDWEEFERLQAERREKQVRVYPGSVVRKSGEDAASCRTWDMCTVRCARSKTGTSSRNCSPRGGRSR